MLKFARTSLLLVIVLFAPLIIDTLRFAHGAGETFAFNAAPQRINEGNSTGVNLVVTVTNAQTPTAYSFTWTVRDPAGTSKTTTKNTLSTASSWSLSAKYPVDFSAGQYLNLTGTYTLTIAENLPSVNSSIATGRFQVGITDYTSYQRTSQVKISASGYLPSDNVTINFVKGTTTVPGFPTSRIADATGRVTLAWPTAPSTPTGSYAASLVGTTTPIKVPPDLQNFTITPANITINGLWSNPGQVERTQRLDLRFNASYPNGVLATSGLSQIRLVEPDGTTVHFVTAAYNNSVNSFRIIYQAPLSAPIGDWTASLDTNSFDDGFGNLGPVTSKTVGFNLNIAVITVIVQTPNSVYNVGNTISIIVHAITPSGQNYTSGTVTATLAYSGNNLAAPIMLVYDQTQGRWTGSYTIKSTDPSGTWLLTVTARDPFSNLGVTTTSFNANTPNTPGTGTSLITGWLPWIVLLVALGLGFATLILRRHNVSRREVTLDVQAIKTKANEVKSDNFLQSIQAQLKRRTDRMQAEKMAKEKKPD